MASMYDRFEPNCPYKDSCKSKGTKCGFCRHNKGKKDYYEPDIVPFRPWNPSPPIMLCTFQSKTLEKLFRGGKK